MIKSNSLGRTFLYVSIALSLVLLTIVLGFSLVSKNSKTILERTNEEVKAFSEFSTKSIVDTYKLYYHSGYYKFKEVIEESLKISKNISKFQLIDTEGNILFDSEKLEGGEPGEKVNSEIEDYSRKLEPTYVFEDSSKRIKQIVYPYLEEWGRHPYSVVYFVNYQKADEDIASLRNQIILFVAFLSLFSLVVLVFAVMSRELALRKKEKAELEELNKQKEEFLMLVTHNLRTPLTRLGAYLLLLEKEQKSKKAQEILETFKISVSELDDLIKKIITITSIITSKEEMALKVQSLVRITEKTISEFKNTAKKKSIKILFKATENIPPVLIDQDMIKKVVHALLENALEFSRPKSTVKVEVKKDKNRIIVSVKDQGIGISEKEKNRLFQMFSRATDVLTYDYPGTGLSLFMSRLIIEAHKGRIWFESKEGEGATFYFNLPTTNN